jgi:hypothetical protein
LKNLKALKVVATASGIIAILSALYPFGLKLLLKNLSVQDNGNIDAASSGEPWFPSGIRQIADWIVSPLYRAGDNKLFKHKHLKQLFSGYGFSITAVYKKGFMQIIKGEKIG